MTSTYEESIVLPKDVFLKLKEATPTTSVITAPESAPLPNDDDEKTTQIGTGAKKKNRQEEEEKAAAEAAKKREETEWLQFLQKTRNTPIVPNGLVPLPSQPPIKDTTPLQMKPDPKAIAHMFPPEFIFKVNRLLYYIGTRPKILSWDPQTMEMIAFNKIYPNSNIIEIISYLIGLQSPNWVTENEFIATLSSKDTIPQDTEIFLQALQNILGNKINNLGLILDQRRVNQVNKFFKAHEMNKEIKEFTSNQQRKVEEHLDKTRKETEQQAEKEKDFEKEISQKITKKRQMKAEMNAKIYQMEEDIKKLAKQEKKDIRFLQLPVKKISLEIMRLKREKEQIEREIANLQKKETLNENEKTALDLAINRLKEKIAAIVAIEKDEDKLINEQREQEEEIHKRYENHIKNRRKEVADEMEKLNELKSEIKRKKARIEVEQTPLPRGREDHEFNTPFVSPRNFKDFYEEKNPDYKTTLLSPSSSSSTEPMSSSSSVYSGDDDEEEEKSQHEEDLNETVREVEQNLDLANQNQNDPIQQLFQGEAGRALADYEAGATASSPQVRRSKRDKKKVSPFKVQTKLRIRRK